jgi:ASPIC and UnbV/FG-GAP-like repeat
MPPLSPATMRTKAPATHQTHSPLAQGTVLRATGVLACGATLGLGLFALASVASAQVAGFTLSPATLPGSPAHTFLTKGIADMDGDGRDDIVRHSMDGTVAILRQSQVGSWTLVSLPSSGISPIATVLADANDDGRPDILTAGGSGIVKFYQSTANINSYTLGQLPGSGFLIQGANAADIDMDGKVDLFGCNDDALSRIWKGNGQGIFTNADSLINMVTVPSSDNSGNYGSTWADIDNDGDLDLYIAKCRANVTNPADPRRINALFISDGNGHYTEQAAARGLADGAQSWVADFADIDNDGDLDCYIANHFDASRLLLNNGTGHFTDITSTSGITENGFHYQALLRDFDNDGLVDLLLTGDTHSLYRNNGNRTFTKQSNPFPGSSLPIRSFALGDLNHDGFLDVYASSWFGESPASADRVWLNANAANGNHFLAITLHGRSGNRSAIGARLTLMDASGRSQTREVRAGESYGISNTLTQHFGLGAVTTLTALHIRWPDGLEQNLSPGAADRFIHITEPPANAPQPALAWAPSATGITLSASNLITQQAYEMQVTPDLSAWTSLHSFVATSSTHSLAIASTTDARRFFRLSWN